ncbi:hypothetical protein AUJ14_01140 [Candidatus Micrarchaeota archaeon CG1_02_55_22]|nr:MAG: hypothetical protein AUJ14_01140 [Candidatus Micrarchaeota archaeon CG1_02_55_22]
MANTINQQIVAGGSPNTGPVDQTTFMPLQLDPKVPPLFKQDNRWEYLKEYIYEFWMVGKKAQVMALVYAVLGLLVINSVPLGAMLLFALSGRYQNIAWWGQGVATKFGRSRALVLLN